MDIVKLTDRQKQTLGIVVNEGTIDYREIDGRSVRALANRGLVKLTENKRGTIVTPTAKGKKLN